MSAARVPLIGTAVLLIAAAVVPSQARRRDLLIVKAPAIRHRHAGRPASSARVVDGDTTEVLAAEPDARLRLKRFPPFVGFAVGTSLDGTGGAVTVSPVFRHDAGRATRVKLRPRVAGGSGGVVGMGDVPIGLPDGTPSNASGALLGRLFDAVQDEGGRWVDETSTFRDARRRELDLQDQGVTDPATHIRDTPLSPDLHLDGDLTVSDGRVTGEIRITDDATGEVIRIPIDEDIDDGDWPDVIRRIVDEVRPRLLDRLRRRQTTTTTTTTSTSTTTATVTTTTSTASTTSTPTTSPSTLPSITTTSTTSTTATTKPLECTTSADCAATACCNVAHRCCDIVNPDDDACGAGSGADQALSCSYLRPDAPPSDLHGECGPQTPPVCPLESYPNSFHCTQCNDTGKYIGYIQ